MLLVTASLRKPLTRLVPPWGGPRAHRAVARVCAQQSAKASSSLLRWTSCEPVGGRGHAQRVPTTGAIAASVLATDGPSDAGGADERFAAPRIIAKRSVAEVAAKPVMSPGCPTMSHSPLGLDVF